MSRTDWGQRDWDERYRASTSLRGGPLLWGAEPNQFLVAEVHDLLPGTALDLACGEGRNAVWLAEQGWDVDGIDFSPVALDRARDLAAARGVEVRWHQHDVRTVPLERDRYHLIVVFYLHLPPADRMSVLGRAAGALAPGGTLLVVGHDVTNLTEGYGGPQDPAILLDADVVADELRAGGVEVVKAERVRREVSTDDGPRTAIDTLVRAIRPARSPQAA